MNNLNNSNHNHFHCYATANDSRLYIKDIKNLFRIKKQDAGVGKTHLCIAISEVQKINRIDRFFVSIIYWLFKNHPSIDLVDVFHKTNEGRDFSSYRILLEKVKKLGSPEDYVFFQNRSGYGPFRKNWYAKYIEQLEIFPSVALCGTTINFTDHPDRSSRKDLPHVQTYAFLSKLSYMSMFGDSFPGDKETDRLGVIGKGEIGISQFFINNNLSITCLEWPELAITNESIAPIDSDIKSNPTKKHYFYHRTYFAKTRRALGRFYRKVAGFLPFFKKRKTH